MGLDTLASAMGEEAVTLEDVCEPYLMQLGFLNRTPRGRCATKAAYEHLHLRQPGQADFLRVPCKESTRKDYALLCAFLRTGRITACWTVPAGSGWKGLGETRCWCARTPRSFGTPPNSIPAGSIPTPTITAARKAGEAGNTSPIFPLSWNIHYGGLTFRIQPTGFKHTGLFPEQAVNWDWMAQRIAAAHRPVKVLNLFRLHRGRDPGLCAAAGAAVTHVDASKGMVHWARENAKLSGLEEKPIRWLVDDCEKFVEREIRRGNQYDGIVMDPPSYGRGPGGEIWKLEEKIYHLVERCWPAASRKTPCSSCSTPTPPACRPR